MFVVSAVAAPEVIDCVTSAVEPPSFALNVMVFALANRRSTTPDPPAPLAPPPPPELFEPEHGAVGAHAPKVPDVLPFPPPNETASLPAAAP